MSLDNTSAASSGPAVKGSAWLENEKVGLLVSIIKSIGPDKISWTNVNIPAGRTKAGSQKMYEILTTVAAEVTMTSGSAITPSTRKRKAAISSDNDGTTALPKTKKTRAPRKMTASKAMDSTTNVTDDNEEGAHNEDELTIKEEADTN